ncbi:MAG: DEAD/DEAH box helicase [Mycobacteriales bacterium]
MSHAVITPSDTAPTVGSFNNLGLPERLVAALTERGLTTPFPIQASTIPDALAGRDVLGRGRTGSGKTLSYGLPLISRLAGGSTEPKRPRGIILAPTRELAVQVNEALEPYGRTLGLNAKTICGGMPMPDQMQALKRGVDIIVATPGRLRDLIKRGSCALDRVEVVVLDEADQMADLGFLPEVRELLNLVPSQSQSLLFSATLDRGVDTLVNEYLHNPVTHSVDPTAGAVTTMVHHVAIVAPEHKTLISAVLANQGKRTIAFVRTQLGADRVAQQLKDAGLRAEPIHGGLAQTARTKTLAEFKEGIVSVLVATDVAARGIHVDDVDLVLHIDPANDSKDYLHRAGRTARAGKDGIVVTLALPHQQRSVARLMEKAGVNAARHPVKGRFSPQLMQLLGARSITDIRAGAARLSVAAAQRQVTELSERLEAAQRTVVQASAAADQLAATAEREIANGIPSASFEREPRSDRGERGRRPQQRTGGDRPHRDFNDRGSRDRAGKPGGGKYTPHGSDKYRAPSSVRGAKHNGPRSTAPSAAGHKGGYRGGEREHV